MSAAFSFLWPLLGVALFGALFAWYLSAVARYKFDYKIRWKSHHESQDWFKVIRAHAFWRHGKRCCFCNGSERLQGHYRDYSRMGRTCGWRDVTTICAKHHNRLPKSQAITATTKRERWHLPLPLPATLWRFSWWTIVLAFWRDRCRCRGCNTRFGTTLHRRTRPPAWWNLIGKLLDFRNCFVWCRRCIENQRLAK